MGMFDFAKKMIIKQLVKSPSLIKGLLENEDNVAKVLAVLDRVTFKDGGVDVVSGLLKGDSDLCSAARDVLRQIEGISSFGVDEDTGEVHVSYSQDAVTPGSVLEAALKLLRRRAS